MATPTRTPKTCWICGRTIFLEDCKVDEHGLPVHEQCYTTKIVLDSKNTPLPFRRPRA
jgi:hypothetical protein